MKKILYVGKITSEHHAKLFCSVQFTNGKLSISGVVGPYKGGNCAGSCGQIEMGFWHRNPEQNDERYSKPTKPEEIDFASGWTADSWLDFLDIWHCWHLNDMRANCEHQTGPEWDRAKKVELVHLTWGTAYHEKRKQAENGTMSIADYANWNSIVHLVESLTIGPKHPDKWGTDGTVALRENLVKIDKTEQKTTGWTNHLEHPEGLLCKPCPVCGYKYGSEWKKQEVPQNVINFLQALPDASEIPAWI